MKFFLCFLCLSHDIKNIYKCYLIITSLWIGGRTTTEIRILSLMVLMKAKLEKFELAKLYYKHLNMISKKRLTTMYRD